jgi:hypothetical protein
MSTLESFNDMLRLIFSGVDVLEQKPRDYSVQLAALYQHVEFGTVRGETCSRTWPYTGL